MWKVPSECPGLDCRWRRSSWGWRRSRGFLAQVSFYRWDLRRKCGFCAFQWRRTPPFFRTCAMMPRYLRRTVGGPAPYRGGGFQLPRLFNAAALFSVSLSVPPFCAPLRPSSLCPSASLRSVLLCGPLLCCLGVHQRCGTQARVAMLTRTSGPKASKRAFAQADRVEPVV